LAIVAIPCCAWIAWIRGDAAGQRCAPRSTRTIAHAPRLAFYQPPRGRAHVLMVQASFASPITVPICDERPIIRATTRRGACARGKR
jgi:hypothetical protein